MKLTDAERAKLAAAIKHFEALQKRYTAQHNGTACEHVKMALIGLDRLSQDPEVVNPMRCTECRWCRPSDKTNRLFCAHEDDEFETYPNDWCCDFEQKNGERREGT